MNRLLIYVEGQTEKAFVEEVLQDYLYGKGLQMRVGASIMGNPRDANRGGVKGWDVVRKDILKALKGDSGLVVSTMVDFYAMPKSGSKAWPGRAQAGERSFADKAKTIELALLADIREMIETRKFIPLVIMHEFEALLFSDCMAFARGIGRPELASELQTIRDQFETPEEINESPITAPSKRIEALMPGYQKPLYGNLAALEIGLDRILSECPHFKAWIETLISRCIDSY